MKSKRSIIRAVLFIIRLQKTVASHHAFPILSHRDYHNRDKSSKMLSPKIDRRNSPSCPPFTIPGNDNNNLLKLPSKLKRSLLLFLLLKC